jgi:biopolymer transport protein ExbD
VRHRRRLRGDDLPIRAEINVTSLVDIAFVLLIIFVITAPMLQGGVEINLPRGDVDPLDSSNDPFFVTIQRDGRVFLEGTSISMADFQQSFPQLARAGSFENVFIRGDSLAAYGAVMRVIETVKGTGKPFALVALDSETP